MGKNKGTGVALYICDTLSATVDGSLSTTTENLEAPNNVYIMCGTNNVDKVYYGSDDLQPSMDSITELIDFVKHTFPSAKIHMVSILPRASPGRNDVVNELNTLIKELCHNKAIDYMDSSILFKFKSGNRREMFFQTPNRYIQDNCHLNFKGIIRLGKFFKYWAHKHC